MSAPAPPPTNVAVSLVDYVSEGKVTPQHFVMLDTPALTEADVPEGGCLLELAYLSVDPYMRGRMRNTKGYFVGPFVPGSPLDGACVATVSASRSPSLPVGSIVTGFLKWQKQQVVDKDMAASLTLVDKSAAPGVPLSAFLGPLGMTGLTAYASLRAIGRPKSGETAYVSAAGGAVGCMAGQLLKRVHGCRVVGSTGSDEKVGP
ncbi:hypothetical protein FOA52_008433 [Chlamydomonas sp. UWO 241]|nr:hypothetical protein FOA52_008433 [Chlamydomonas sp. UWO 241]